MQKKLQQNQNRLDDTLPGLALVIVVFALANTSISIISGILLVFLIRLTWDLFHKQSRAEKRYRVTMFHGFIAVGTALFSQFIFSFF
ncbi:hypothetical protein MUN89_02225 [Halobacillus salinarum]|uniref:Uncharacterized protein n=1 Tax=Halobacillus salinarum TaxID=2932257 RepID=A0ABY4EMF4_9BACI|nr:hypothetical protein [Halobacillus salinarum]UOQ44792.1 hypothetical protein MUN89_02225 [Halobacillus salinarum]